MLLRVTAEFGVEFMVEIRGKIANELLTCHRASSAT
jgi:hypothetical protein